MLIDEHMPTFDVSERHWRLVRASAEDCYAAMWNMDLARSAPATALFVIRGIPSGVVGRPRFTRRLGLTELLDMGFVTLDEDSPYELVLGSVGRFWRPTASLLELTREGFEAFDEPGYAKGTMSFEVTETKDRCVVATETRVLCTDGSARRSFGRYWQLIGPFSAWLRRVMLDDIKERAERRT